MCTSVPHTPHRATSTSASRGPSGGTGKRSICRSAPPYQTAQVCSVGIAVATDMQPLCEWRVSAKDDRGRGSRPRRSPMTSTRTSNDWCACSRIACTASRCALRAARKTPRRAPRTPSCAPTARWRSTTREQRRTLLLKPWLYRITLNVVRNRVRRPTLKVAVDVDGERAAIDWHERVVGPAEAVTLAAERHREMDAWWRELPERYGDGGRAAARAGTVLRRGGGGARPAGRDDEIRRAPRFALAARSAGRSRTAARGAGGREVGR